MLGWCMVANFEVAMTRLGNGGVANSEEKVFEDESMNREGKQMWLPFEKLQQ